MPICPEYSSQIQTTKCVSCKELIQFREKGHGHGICDSKEKEKVE